MPPLTQHCLVKCSCKKYEPSGQRAILRLEAALLEFPEPIAAPKNRVTRFGERTNDAASTSPRARNVHETKTPKENTPRKHSKNLTKILETEN